MRTSKFLQSSNGVIRFCKDPVAFVVHVDATLSHMGGGGGGGGGAWGCRVSAAEISFNYLAITQCEMYNIVVAVKLWGHEWRDKVVNIKCDNESAVAVSTTGRTKN